MNEEIAKFKAEVLEKRNELGRCPTCNANIKDRTISLYKGLINTLYRVYCWCGEKKRHEFKRSEVNHLIGKVDYTRFGDLIRFGGIVYKPQDENKKTHKAEFGINMARAKSFFAGEYEIPVQIVVNQITNEILAATYVKVKDNPGNYCLTHKGAEFLKGKEIPRFAIASKAEGHQIGYYMPDEYTVTIKDFAPDEEYWEGINFDIVEGDIVEGRIVKDLSEQKPVEVAQSNLF